MRRVSKAQSWFSRVFLRTSLVASLVLATTLAYAAGQVQWKSNTFVERTTKSWFLELTVSLPKAPDFASLPMKFEFQPIAYYERAMMDGDKLVERVVPLEGRQAMIESVDVGFMDPGSGKVEKRTRFSFKVTRAHGYEAGEYRVTIKDSRTGQTIGTPQTLKFQGENEIIDRRAIVFSGEKKKKKPEEKPEETPAAAKSDDADEASSETESEASGSEAANETEASPADEDASLDGDNPGTIKEKPGGCGCRTVGGEEGAVRSPWAALGLVGLGLALARRRFGRA